LSPHLPTGRSAPTPVVLAPSATRDGGREIGSDYQRRCVASRAALLGVGRVTTSRTLA
jgi:hypothetical protein